MEGVRAEALGQTKLAFDDLVNEFNAAQNTPGVEEALETRHWSHAAFYPPVILFDDVVQVGTISNLDGTVPTVIEFVIHTHAIWHARPYANQSSSRLEKDKQLRNRGATGRSR